MARPTRRRTAFGGEVARTARLRHCVTCHASHRPPIDHENLLLPTAFAFSSSPPAPRLPPPPTVDEILDRYIEASGAVRRSKN
jgi:hypothetical protein